MDSDDDNDGYIVCGTPLPAIDDETIVNRKAAQDLTVRDEKGRLRFHGAFTGGFSAGYFNSVGTKEGWEPTTFVSSRSSRSTSSSFQQKPEDYMDNEDFSEFGIAPKRIRTTSNFADTNSSSQRKRKAFADEDAIIPGEPPLKDLVKPVVESIGIIILKKLGWRQGQGIGPRTKKQKIIGCSLGPLGPERPDQFLNSVTFAPDDTPEIPYTPKDDFHGIGYTGLSTQAVLNVPLSSTFSNSRTKTWLPKHHKKLSISGQAFGVGALEDDDEDIYSKEDMSQYDFSEFANPESVNSSGAKVEVSQKDSVVEGFCLASNPPSKKKRYPLPILPPDFQPNHKANSSKMHSLNNETKCKLNPALRSVLLGEKVFVKTDKPVERKDSKDRRASKFDQLPTLPTTVEPLVAPKLVTNPVLSVPPLIRMSFKPFASDTLKQKRYEEFLKHSCDKDYLTEIQPSNLTEWEKQRELDEFITAASFFQPIPKELESRFESRSHLDVETESGLIQIKKKDETRNSPVLGKQSSTRYQRNILEWHPASLLCKRFNVPNPYPDSKYDGVYTDKKKPSLFDSLSSGLDIKKNVVVTKEKMVSENLQEQETKEKEKSDDKSISVDRSSSESQESTAKEKPEMQNQKPSMDLFKDIFQSSSSEDNESSSSDDDDTSKTDTLKASFTTDALATSNETKLKDASSSSATSNPAEHTAVKSTPKQAFGVFANLDLDALNKRNIPANKTSSQLSSVETNSTKSSLEKLSEVVRDTQNNLETAENSNTESSLTADSYYGPELPPTGIYVPERSRSDTSHHKHSKHKSKHHKHKEKKKKKKKHKREHLKKDRSDSSVDSDEDISPEYIVEKLKQLQKSKRRPRS